MKKIIRTNSSPDLFVGSYFCCLEESEEELSEFDKWIVKKAPDYMERFSYEDNEDDE